MEFQVHSIKCNTFWDVETVIKKAKAKIKDPRSAAEKRYYAQDILVEAKTLLSCPDYNARNSDCKICHSISHKCIEEYKHLAKVERRKIAKRY